MNVGGIKANTGQRQMCREVACEEILIIVNFIIAKSVHKLPLKASKQIAFANFPEPLFEPVNPPHQNRNLNKCFANKEAFCQST